MLLWAGYIVTATKQEVVVFWELDLVGKLNIIVNCIYNQDLNFVHCVICRLTFSFVVLYVNIM